MGGVNRRECSKIKNHNNLTKTLFYIALAAIIGVTIAFLISKNNGEDIEIVDIKPNLKETIEAEEVSNEEIALVEDLRIEIDKKEVDYKNLRNTKELLEELGEEDIERKESLYFVSSLNAASKDPERDFVYKDKNWIIKSGNRKNKNDKAVYQVSNRTDDDKAICFGEIDINSEDTIIISFWVKSVNNQKSEVKLVLKSNQELVEKGFEVRGDKWTNVYLEYKHDTKETADGARILFYPIYGKEKQTEFHF